MDKVTANLTVFFEEPFWVGLFERTEGGHLSVCKVTFGAEPRDYEVWEFILENYDKLKFSPSIDVIVKKESANPKRIQRNAKKQTLSKGIGTKAQQALQMQREERKADCKAIRREQNQAEQQRQFELKQQKRKQKHKGK